jgi:hypothetical protein
MKHEALIKQYSFFMLDNLEASKIINTYVNSCGFYSDKFAEQSVNSDQRDFSDNFHYYYVNPLFKSAKSDC